MSRSDLALSRLGLARAGLASCHWCAHHCGVDRTAGQLGRCRASASANVFSAQVEVSDELELIPVFAIAFSGCDLRCDFCITGAESWHPRTGRPFEAGVLAEQARRALSVGARTIMVLGGEPTIHLPAVLELVSELPDEARLAWKTNAHGTATSRALLDGLFDVWVADYKFGNDTCAERLSRTPDYVRHVRENLRWAAERSDLIVRHLLMPGHGACCWKPVAEWLASELPGVKVNLRTGFWPAWRSARQPELSGPATTFETGRAWELARELGLNLIS